VSRAWPSIWPLALCLGVWGILWAVLFAVVPPGHQDFPLNDDWAYAKGAFAFARGEGVHYQGWASMPLLGQWLWALPFVRLLGESHVALRLSTIVLGGLGVAAFFDLLRQEAGLPPRRAAFTAAALALNPLFFLLAGTFMTDVAALAFSLAALALYHRAARNGRVDVLMAAAAVALLATITRQNAVAAPLAAGALLWRHAGRSWPAWALAVVLPVAAGGVAHIWFAARPDVLLLTPTVAADRLPILAFTALHTLGLAVLPALFGSPRLACWRGWVLGLLVMVDGATAAAAFGASFSFGGVFPYLGNMLTPWGTFESNTVVAGDRPLLMGLGLRYGLTLAGCVGGAGLLARVFRSVCAGFRPGLLCCFSLLHVPFLLIAPSLFDRYLLVLVPGALALTAGVPGGTVRWKAGLAGLAGLAVFGALSMALWHDWLAWNCARWEVGRWALARDIAATDIEGGFEWDGWYAPGPAARPSAGLPRGLVLPFNRDRFPQVTGRLALTFSDIPGSKRIDAAGYRLWLYRQDLAFYLVEQTPAIDPMEQDPSP
jgi:4-amino-4-deoxy-L-arabinose transferase-like glycosyltransferase